MASPDDLDSPVELEPNEDIFQRTASGEPSLWLWAQTCPESDCPCRTALLVAATSREQLEPHVELVRKAWEQAEEQEEFRRLVPSDVVAFELEIDSGQISMPLGDDEELSPEVARVARRVDGDLLDRLASQWHLGKGMADMSNQPVPPAEIHDFQPGQLLAWDEVYSGARMDFYAFEDASFEVIDTYCVRPKCECNDVHIQFYRLPALDLEDFTEDEREDERVPRAANELAETSDEEHGVDDEHVYIGTVAVKLEEPVQVVYQPNQGQAKLEQLFQRYQERYPHWQARLADRADKMASFGERLHAHLQQQRRRPWVSTSRKHKGKK